jgi:CII-binding regulator of phage lambda lysogenization HflD
MDINISLSTIILGELVFVLLLLSAFLVRYIVQQKKIIGKLIEKLNTVKNDVHSDFYNKNNIPPTHPAITEYFEKSLGDSLQRFQKFTASTQPQLNEDHPFSGRVAALRHIYLSAEQELFAERGITHAGWGTLERRLASIIQGCGQNNTQYETTIADLQRQLRASGNELKKHQGKISHLLKRLENLRKEQHDLEQSNTKNHAVISHLQDALNKLKNVPPVKIEEKKPSFVLALNDNYIEQFGKENSEENHNLRALLHEIKNTPSALSPAQQKRIDNQINSLEIELLKSDRHINNLKQQLKEAKLQITNYALMMKDNSVTPAGDIDSLYSNLMKKMSSVDENDPDTIIAEINNLRESNKFQHNTISSLEDEICTLKDSISSEDSDDVNKEKEKEIQRLERLVKECQGCIVILEDEVDNLYARLQEQTSQLSQLPTEGAIEQHSSGSGEDVGLLLQELEKVATNYQHVYAINNTFLAFLQCRSFDALVTQLLLFINAFDLPAGFYIHCTAGEAEHFPEHFFNHQHWNQLITSEAQEQLVHLDECTLFIYSNIRAMSRTNGEEHTSIILNTNFQMVIEAVNERLNELTPPSTNPHNNQDAMALDNHNQIKDMLTNLNIRYAFQVDENRKTFDNFITELRRAYSLLELQGTGAIVLDNAVNEFEMRMSLLLEGGDAIDKEISLLVDRMTTQDTSPS